MVVKGQIILLKGNAEVMQVSYRNFSRRSVYLEFHLSGKALIPSRADKRDFCVVALHENNKIIIYGSICLLGMA